ncbi:MAG: type II toxin-antitoxin system VapC family toxin [Actinobacteria bacterium]|nr:type II toxin-antitoxin system VapC family toxin [Actinomycetota bacterium]
MSDTGRSVLVIDSSVAYKWFNNTDECHVEYALELLSAHSRGDLLLAAPPHMPTEVLGGLRYANLDAATLHTAAEGLFEADILIVPLDAELMKTALDLALAHDLTLHDAAFPALAIKLDCELVTADRALARVTECPVKLLA